MTQDHWIPALIIGLVLSFGVGFLVGHSATEDHYPQVSTSCAETAKVAQENSKECFRILSESLQHKAQEPGVAH